MPGGNHRRCGPALAWPSAVRVLLLALALAALQSGPALAHAVLIESVPADGERLDRAPSELRLQFNEPVSPVTVRLLDGGRRNFPRSPSSRTATRSSCARRGPCRTGPISSATASPRSTPMGGGHIALRGGRGASGRGAGEDAPSWTAWAAVAARLLLYLTALGAVASACSSWRCGRPRRWPHRQFDSPRGWPWRDSRCWAFVSASQASSSADCQSARSRVSGRGRWRCRPPSLPRRRWPPSVWPASRSARASPPLGTAAGRAGGGDLVRAHGPRRHRPAALADRSGTHAARALRRVLAGLLAHRSSWSLSWSAQAVPVLQRFSQVALVAVAAARRRRRASSPGSSSAGTPGRSRPPPTAGACSASSPWWRDCSRWRR